MYQAGIETRQRILDAARTLFRERGYKAVAVRDICDVANVKLGTFTYYFPRKSDLLGELYEEYMQSCRDYVDVHASTDLSPAEHHLYVVMLYYFALYRDERAVAFHRETLALGSMNVYFGSPRAQIADFSEAGDVLRDDPAYDLAVIADNAVRRELNMNFIDQDDHSLDNVRRLLTDIYTVTARLFGTDHNLMLTYIERAYGFADAHRSAPVSLLGCSLLPSAE